MEVDPPPPRPLPRHPASSPSEVKGQEVPDLLMTPSTPSGSRPAPVAGRQEVKGQEVPVTPVPRHITPLELNVLQECLQRWRSEVETDVKELQSRIRGIEESIQGVYEDEELKGEPYLLHAVLVHEGQASAGHYWAYIRHHARDLWLKFNDISVTRCSWEELQRESAGGGHSNASAYCLMYVSANRQDLFQESCKSEEPGCGGSADSIQELAEDLKQLVLEDNRAFETEMQEWDEVVDHTKRADLGQAAGAADTAAPPAQKPSGLGCRTPPSARKPANSPRRGGSDASLPASGSTPPLASAHLSPSSSSSSSSRSPSQVPAILQSAYDTLYSVRETYKKSGADTALVEVMGVERSRHKQGAFRVLSSLPQRDLRLTNPLVYFILCHAPHFVVEHTLLEQLTKLKTLVDAHWCQSIVRAADYKFTQSRLDMSEEQEHQYKTWHEDYNLFRKTVQHFLQAIQLYYLKENYVDALPYFVNAYRINKALTASHSHKEVNVELLAYFRRQCMLQVNHQCASSFENEQQQEALWALDTMIDSVVPCMGHLVRSVHQEDRSVAEEIRNRWYSFLGGSTISDKLQEKYQDLMPRLCDDELTENYPLKIPVMQPLNSDLSQEWSQAIELIRKNDPHLLSPSEL